MSDTYLDEEYFEWLYSQICSVKQKNPARSHWKLFRLLYAKEFTWSVPNDDNRADDGRDLRREWVDLGKNPERIDQNWLNMGCSFLELLIALARRASFLDGEDPITWFWKMLENLKLSRYNDLVHMPENEINGVLDRVIQRTYTKTGHGGLFPLKRPRRDQREVELWYQLHAYIEERS